MRNLLILICAFLFVFFDVRVYAGSSVYVAQNMDFGRVIPRTDELRVVLDALGSRIPACEPVANCQVVGGHPAALYFYGFGELDVKLSYPNDNELHTSDGVRAGMLRNLHMYSHLEAYDEGTKKKALVGGVLLTGSPAYGKKLTGTIRVEITTY